MTNNLETFVIIVAAGSGSRMQSSIPKQFLEIDGKPILYYTIKTFLDAEPSLHAIVVLRQDYLADAASIFGGLPLERITFISGGETRFHSVKNGLQYIPKNAIVLVHDGVRCMVTPQLIQRCCDAAIQYGNAIPAINATDSIRIKEGETNKSVDREKVFIIQTPQTFRSDILLKAFEKEYSPLFTDEASVVESDGVAIHLVEGEHQNIKVTRPIDLLIVQHLMQNNTKA